MPENDWNGRGRVLSFDTVFKLVISILFALLTFVGGVVWSNQTSFQKDIGDLKTGMAVETKSRSDLGDKVADLSTQVSKLSESTTTLSNTIAGMSGATGVAITATTPSDVARQSRQENRLLQSLVTEMQRLNGAITDLKRDAVAHDP